MGKLPPSRTKPGALGMDPATQKGEAQFYRCPKGHKLPYKTANGDCTPIWCADAEGARGSKSPRKAQKEAENAITIATDGEVEKRLAKISPEHKDLAVTEGEQARTKDIVHASRALGRHVARTLLAPVPDALTGADAEKFADEKIVSLLPFAAAELEYQLKFGDDGQRMKAAEKVLDATGRGKREAGGGGTAPIVMINMGGGSPGGMTPWRAKPASQVVEAEPAKLPEGEG